MNIADTYTITSTDEEGPCENCGFPMYTGDACMITETDKFVCGTKCADALYTSEMRYPFNRKEAIHWYAVKGYDLQTIADHYGMTYDELANRLNTIKRDSRTIDQALSFVEAINGNYKT